MTFPATDHDSCTVVSILPIRLSEEKPLLPSHYEIPAVKDPETQCNTLLVRRGSFKVYIDDTRPALVVPEPSEVIALAICRDFKVASSHYEPGVAEPGLFFVQGDYKSSDVLQDKNIKPALDMTRELQRNWFKRLVMTADDDWSKYRMRRMISDLQRIAVKCLKLDRPWDIDIEVLTSARTSCKFCRAEVHPDAIICMHCRGILDMARYKVEFQGLPQAG